MRFFSLLILSFISCQLWAQEAQTQVSQAQVTTPQVGKHVAANLDVLSVLISLLAVLALIVACAFLLKRFQPMQKNLAGMKIISSLHLGSKERLVVVEIDNKQLLLGVTAQQITHLKTLETPLEVAQPLATNLGENIVRLLKKNDK